MNVLHFFGITSGILSAVCYIPYIKDILANRTKPERASWLIWSVLGSIAFLSQLLKGASDSLWLTGVSTIGVLVIFLFSLKKGVGGLNKRDIISLLLAVLGLILWFYTNDALYALIIVILVDAIGGYLTIIKAYRDPASETLLTWLLAGIAGLIAMIAVGKLDYILLLYPTYIFLINFTVVTVIVLGKRRIK